MGDGSTTLRLYYVATPVSYTIEYWTVSGSGVATKYGERTDREGIAGTWAKADAEYKPGTTTSFLDYFTYAADGSQPSSRSPTMPSTWSSRATRTRPTPSPWVA